MKKILVLLLLTVLTVLPTFAVNWVQIADKTYMDTDSIEPYENDNDEIVPNYYSFNVKHLNGGEEFYKGLELVFKQKIWYSESLEIIDIEKNSITTKGMVIYNLKKEPLDGSGCDDNELDWKKITPESLAEVKLGLVKKAIKKE